MRAPETILLDLDGTLVDSKPGIVASYDATLRDLGHVPDPDFDLTFVIGPVLSDVMGIVLAHYGDARVDEAILAYRRHYADVGVVGVTPYAGIAALLPALRDAGSSLFLATSKRTTFATRILDRLGFAKHFAGIYGSEPGGARDHKPELIADVLKTHRVDPARAVMVGDRRYDIAGAQSNGIFGIGVLWGYGGRRELEDAGADAIVASTEALEEVLAG